MLLTFPYTVLEVLKIFAHNRFYYNITLTAKIANFNLLRLLSRLYSGTISADQ